jgi:hypothetical protein
LHNTQSLTLSSAVAATIHQSNLKKIISDHFALNAQAYHRSRPSKQMQVQQNCTNESTFQFGCSANYQQPQNTNR